MPIALRLGFTRSDYAIVCCLTVAAESRLFSPERQVVTWTINVVAAEVALGVTARSVEVSIGEIELRIPLGPVEMPVRKVVLGIPVWSIDVTI